MRHCGTYGILRLATEATPIAVPGCNSVFFRSQHAEETAPRVVEHDGVWQYFAHSIAVLDS